MKTTLIVGLLLALVPLASAHVAVCENGNCEDIVEGEGPIFPGGPNYPHLVVCVEYDENANFNGGFEYGAPSERCPESEEDDG